jgi:hypothetical protein
MPGHMASARMTLIAAKGSEAVVVRELEVGSVKRLIEPGLASCKPLDNLASCLHKERYRSFQKHRHLTTQHA